MNFNEKCDFLNSLIDSPNDLEFQLNMNDVSKLSQDRSPFIRSLVAKLLFDYNNDFSKNILLELANDKDNLVRVEAADSLKSFINIEVYNRLKCMAEFDRYYLSRAYSIYSMSITGISLKQIGLSAFILDRLKKERYVINRIFCHQSLYVLGNKESIFDLMGCFNSNNYKNKCAVINALIEILSIENINDIKNFICSLNSNELPSSVSSSIKILSDKINNFTTYSIIENDCTQPWDI